MLLDKSHQSLEDHSLEREISLQDIFDFLQGAWKTVAITMVLGLAAAITYLAVTPKQFEAIAQIRMAQISITNPANPFGVSVEDPVSLIARMQIPTNANQIVIESCDYQNNKIEPAQALAKDLKLSMPKGLLNTVEIKISARSPEKARTCISAVVEQITKLQAQFAKPFIEEAMLRLAQDDERIEIARRLITKADQSGSAMSATYLSARDEISYFLTDREKMIDLINSAEQRGTKLISPIYASEQAVAPKKATSLLAGVLAGLFLGLALAFVRQVWQKRRAQASIGSHLWVRAKCKLKCEIGR